MMAGDNIDEIATLCSLNVKTVHGILLQVFSGKYFDLALISLVEQSHRTIRWPYCNIVFQRANTVWNSLLDLDIAMEPMRHLVI